MNLDRLTLFFGRATDIEARVYAQAPAEVVGDFALTGTVLGPYCEYSQTLPAKTTLRDLGPGPSLLGEAIVPDPCFWTPDEPYYYRVHVQLQQGDRVVAQSERLLGIRPLAVERRNLFFKSKRWVVRGVVSREEDLAAWHRAPAAMWVEQPNEELCRAASTTGVLLLAALSGDDLLVELDRLSRWPAVGIAVLPRYARLPESRLLKNLLLAEHFGSQEPLDPSPWAQLVVVDVADAVEFSQRAASCALPILARRPAPEQLNVAEARGACDALQRELAPFGDFAGYLV